MCIAIANTVLAWPCLLLCLLSCPTGFNFPAVPTGNIPDPSGGNSGGGDGDLDFDDLTKRFERLKGRK